MQVSVGICRLPRAPLFCRASLCSPFTRPFPQAIHFTRRALFYRLWPDGLIRSCSAGDPIIGRTTSILTNFIVILYCCVSPAFPVNFYMLCGITMAQGKLWRTWQKGPCRPLRTSGDCGVGRPKQYSASASARRFTRSENFNA